MEPKQPTSLAGTKIFFEIKAFVGLMRGQIVGCLGGFIKVEGRAGSVHVFGRNLVTAAVRHGHLKVSGLIATGPTDGFVAEVGGNHHAREVSFVVLEGARDNRKQNMSKGRN